jgi:hypothetical protein
MTFTDIVYFIGEFLSSTFEILPALGNLPNYIFLVLGFVLLFIWIKVMNDYNQEAERNGTLK